MSISLVPASLASCRVTTANLYHPGWSLGCPPRPLKASLGSRVRMCSQTEGWRVCLFCRCHQSSSSPSQSPQREDSANLLLTLRMVFCFLLEHAVALSGSFSAEH